MFALSFNTLCSFAIPFHSLPICQYIQKSKACCSPLRHIVFHINDIANENGHTIIDVSTSVCHVEVSLGVPGPLQMRGGGWGGLPADWRYPQDIGASIC